MASWVEFVAARPALAAGIRALVCQYGPGLGYLATVRADGGPRVHPVSPVITDRGLFCFVISSPKRNDLDRDGRYALHTFPPEQSDDEAHLSGFALPVRDPVLIHNLSRDLRADPAVDWRLYELSVDTAMLMRQNARVITWRDPRARLPRSRTGPCVVAADSVQ